MSVSHNGSIQQSYHSQESQGWSSSSTLMLIFSQNKVSLKCRCCKMYRLPPPPCKGIRMFLSVEFGFRENLSCACRIPLMIGIQKASSTNKKDVQYMESGIQVVKFRIQQCLDSLRWGKGIVPVPHTKKQTLQRGNRRKKPTDLTNGSLNAQKFLQLNPFLIWIIIIISFWSAVYTVIFGELL